MSILEREKVDRPTNEGMIRGIEMTNIRIKGILHPICPTCKGNGHIRVTKYIPCANPHAEGYVDESYTKVCNTCNGKGYI